MIYMNDRSSSFVPVLDRGPLGARKLGFEKWWNEAVYENAKGQKLSRFDLVSSLRSKDGGSHFDGELPSTPYLEMKDNGAGWMSTGGDLGNSVAPVKNGHLATMRHIAFEVQQSIVNYLQTNPL